MPRAAHVDRALQYELRKLAPLVGGTITRLAEVDGGEGEMFPGFKVKTADGEEHLVVIMRDEEGNGPGSVQVDP